MRLLFIILLVQPFLLFVALAEEQAKEKLAPTRIAKFNSPEFSIDKGAADELFNKSSQKPSTSSAESSNWSTSVGAGYFTPQDFAIQTDYYELDYAKQVNGVPFFTVSGGVKVFNTDYLAGGALGKLSYGYIQGIYQVKSRSNSTFSDTVSTQLIPIRAALFSDVQNFGQSFLKIGVEAGAGQYWISQSGTLDGVSQSISLPTYFAGPRVTLFGQKGSESVLDGVIIESIYEKSGDTNKVFAGWTHFISGQFAF